MRPNDPFHALGERIYGRDVVLLTRIVAPPPPKSFLRQAVERLQACL